MEESISSKREVVIQLACNKFIDREDIEILEVYLYPINNAFKLSCRSGDNEIDVHIPVDFVDDVMETHKNDPLESTARIVSVYIENEINKAKTV